MTRQVLKTSLLVFLFAASSHCSEGSFSGGTQKTAKKPKAQAQKGEQADNEDPDSTEASDNDPGEIVESEGKISLEEPDSETAYDGKTTISSATPELIEDETGVVRENFSFDNKLQQAKVDYLLVIDHSCSMAKILRKTTEGLLGLLNQPGVFPTEARIAVMTTAVASGAPWTEVGGKVKAYSGIEAEPGFLDFVDGKSIEAYRVSSASNSRKKSYSLNGCDDKWFAPGATAAEGHFCLQAAMQSASTCVGQEAGASAFVQLLEKHKAPLFREGANLNVIFISDTHEPGVSGGTTLAKTFDEVKALTQQNSFVSSLKFHALAPDTKCTGEQLWDKLYYSLADASGGFKQDPCTVDDYSEFLKQMVEESKVLESEEYVLKAKALDIVRVLVDGNETTDFKLSDDGKTITVRGLKGKKSAQIQVVYRGE